MKTLEEILTKSEKLQSQIDELLVEVNKLQASNWKNIFFYQERNINKLLNEVNELQAKANALMWVLS